MHKVLAVLLGSALAFASQVSAVRGLQGERQIQDDKSKVTIATGEVLPDSSDLSYTRALVRARALARTGERSRRKEGRGDR